MSPANAPTEPESQPGDLLRDLEARQDDVLAQLDALDARIAAVLKSCGVRTLESDETAPATART